MKQTVVVISGEKRLDDFMHAADVFESFKAVAKVTAYELDTNEKWDPVHTIKCLKEAAENTGQRVVAIFYPGNPAGAYLDTTVKCISDGQQWGMLDKVLAYYNYVSPNTVDVAPLKKE